MLLCGMGEEKRLRVQLDALLGALGSCPERCQVGVVAKPEEHRGAGRGLHHVGLVLGVVEPEDHRAYARVGWHWSERWPPSSVSR